MEQKEIELRKLIQDKTIERLSETFVKSYSERMAFNHNQNLCGDTIKSIQQLLTEAYNEGVTDAAGKARVIGMPCGDIRTCGCMGSCERPDWVVDKQSILSLLKK